MGKLVDKLMPKGLVDKASKEEITNDGGLGNLAREVQEKIKSGEIYKMEKKELIDTYMAFIKISDNPTMIRMARVAVNKKNKDQMIALIQQSVSTALKFSAPIVEEAKTEE